MRVDLVAMDDYEHDWDTKKSRWFTSSPMLYRNPILCRVRSLIKLTQDETEKIFAKHSLPLEAVEQQKHD